MKQTQQVGDNIFSIDVMDRGKGFTSAYLIRGEKLALIDCGPTSSADALLAGLQELQIDPLELDYLILTHIHLDHAGGAGYLAEKLPRLKVFVHEKGAKHLVDPSQLVAGAKAYWGEVFSVFGKLVPVPSHRVQTLQDGAEIDLGRGRRLKVIDTVGHSPHHHVYFDSDTRGIFSGDALGLYFPRLSEFLNDDIIIPGAPHPIRLEMMLASIQKLALLNVENIYFSHFGSKNHGQAIIERVFGQISVWSEIIKKVSQADQPLETAIEQINNYVFRSMVNQGHNLAEHPELGSDKQRVDQTIVNSVKGFWNTYL
jgi:glyoxylase-like metal-dependent hydrolase (beta-lactamase superfamily II)